VDIQGAYYREVIQAMNEHTAPFIILDGQGQPAVVRIKITLHRERSRIHGIVHYA